MKLVIAVLPGRTAPRAQRRLQEGHIAFTRLASSGAFLEQGNTTLLIGVPRTRVEQVLDLLRAASPGEGVAFVVSARRDSLAALEPFARPET